MDRWEQWFFLGGGGWGIGGIHISKSLEKENVECMPEHTVHLLLVVMEERLCISRSVI